MDTYGVTWHYRVGWQSFPRKEPKVQTRCEILSSTSHECLLAPQSGALRRGANEKLFAIGTNKSLEKKNRVFFIVVLRFLVSILQGSVRQISGGLGWTPIEERVKERSRVDVVSCCVFWGGSTGLSWFRRYIEDWELMWSAAVSFEVDKQDFPVSEDLLPRRRQDTDEVSLICWGVLQYAILLRRIICMNTGWVNP